MNDEDARRPAAAGTPRAVVFRARFARWNARIRRSVATRDVAGLKDVVFGGVRHRLQRAAPFEAVLFRSGRYVHRGGSARPVRAVRRFRLPDGVERVGATGFVIELDRLTTYCGFSFAPGGWHPFLELIREYEANPALRYEDSVLYRLYTRFTPTTIQEAVFDDDETVLPPLDRLPPERRLLRRLWALDVREVSQLVRYGSHGPLSEAESRYFGPKARAAGAWHFQKVLDLYRSVQQHGYDPVRFGGELPRGYFLVRGGEYRFVIGHANRRLAGVHAAGVRQVVASFFEHVPPVINEEDLERWSTAQGGIFPHHVAAQLFDRLFTATGAERAEALGLR